MFDIEHELFVWRRGWEDTLTASGMSLPAAKEWIAARERLLWNLTMPGRVQVR
jgi:hypothetical protein